MWSTSETSLFSRSQSSSCSSDKSIMCGTTITTTSEVVMKSSTLCSGNFIPLNDSTELKVQQFEQERIQCIAKEIATTSTPITIEKKSNNRTKLWLKKKNTTPVVTTTKPSTKKLSWKLFRRTSTMKTTDVNDDNYDDNSSIESFYSSDDDDDDSACVVDCQVQEKVVSQKENNKNSYIDSNTIVDDGSVPSVSGTETTASQVEEEEEETVSTIHVPMSETPDVYGQIHPIENDILINNALTIFEEQWKLLPSSKNSIALLAEEYCPNIVSIHCQHGKEFKLQFLRCEVYRVTDSIERYVNYWNKRYELFGSQRAFQPITMDKLTDNERHILSNNYISYVPPSPSSATVQHNKNEIDTTSTTTTTTTAEIRGILFVDYSGFVPKTMANNDFVRALWYMVHCITNECVETQKRGLVIIATAKTTTNSNSPSISFYTKIVQYFKKTLPVRISGYHVVYPPYYLQFLYPITCSFLSRNKMKMRLLVHCTITNTTELLDQFSNKYGIYTNQLPTSIGGNYIVDEQQWIQQQIINGK